MLLDHGGDAATSANDLKVRPRRGGGDKRGHQKRTCTWNMEHGEEHVGTCSFYMMSMYYEHVEHTEGTC